MALKATKLRQDLYRILDEVLETGIPIEIERKGKIICLIPKEPANILDRLDEHQITVGDPEDLVHVDWSGEWTGLNDEP